MFCCKWHALLALQDQKVLHEESLFQQNHQSQFEDRDRPSMPSFPPEDDALSIGNRSSLFQFRLNPKNFSDTSGTTLRFIAKAVECIQVLQLFRTIRQCRKIRPFKMEKVLTA
jgi:hypothetical protein